MPELAISAEKVGFLIEKTREFDVKEGVSDPDSGSNGADDGMIDHVVALVEAKAAEMEAAEAASKAEAA